MYIDDERRKFYVDEIERYNEELQWWLVPVEATGERPKKPLYGGWPDVYLDTGTFKEIIATRDHVGIGVNLGRSGLIDLEADSPEGNDILDELCRDVVVPCWRSGRGLHRLFLADERISYKETVDKIEFRTGRHQSVIPPTVFPENEAEYEWLVSPFDVPPAPIPEHVFDFYCDQGGTVGAKKKGERKETEQRWPYRDDFDYLLRHYDLLEEAKAAGVVFYLDQPDKNGNLPCYVPAVLRDDKDDNLPSGVFNTFNGSLRDFATNTNHLYFNVISALTGEPSEDILRRYDADAGKISGRPHSRRIAIPRPAANPQETISLDVARANLELHYSELLDRPHQPQRLNLIKGPPGLGKTHTLCKLLGEKGKKAIILTLENGLANHHRDLINDLGQGRAMRMPVLRETNCPSPAEYEATVSRGFKASQSTPCRRCPVGVQNCQYFIQFNPLADADQLCCAAIYHTHENFYQSYANEERPLVVFDENAVDVLLEPHSNSMDEWRRWLNFLNRYDGRFNFSQSVIIRFRDWLTTVADAFHTDTEKFQVVPIPDDLRIEDLKHDEELSKWINQQAGEVPGPNLYRAFIYLLSTADSAVILESKGDSINIRFRKNNPLPKEKEVFLLDATANEELIRAIATDWDIHTWDCEQIEQQGEIIQIMDYDVSRNRIKKELKKHAPHNPCWLIQILDNITEEYGQTGLISFKAVEDKKEEMDVLSQLTNRGAISEVRHFPCRGHNMELETLIILGTPYKDEVAIIELALATWGIEGVPTSQYGQRRRQGEYFISTNMGFEEEHIRPVEQFVISAELSQAVGRSRPLQNQCTIFVISNAEIEYWQANQFLASELFDLRKCQKSDAAKRYEVYHSTAVELLQTGNVVTNPEICRRIDMVDRTGQRYMNHLKDDLKDVLIISPRSIRLRDDSEPPETAV